jgi:hypothetical protein
LQTCSSDTGRKLCQFHAENVAIEFKPNLELTMELKDLASRIEATNDNEPERLYIIDYYPPQNTEFSYHKTHGSCFWGQESVYFEANNPEPSSCKRFAKDLFEGFDRLDLLERGQGSSNWVPDIRVLACLPLKMFHEVCVVEAR